MGHKYFDELGIKGEKTCLFNTEETDMETLDDGTKRPSARQARFEQQRTEYGFDERETWSLDFTAASWLHSHLKMFKDVGGEMVDFTFWKFDVPIIGENGKEIIEEHTQIECIEIMIDYLEKYLKAPDMWVNNQYMTYVQCAFKIFAIVFPAMWW